ncbi:hypothetical protein SDC9_170864 [bioreactor metagenome]|uniref:Uncharacterized protein n=1 Tax=bioreactor metagenome TaxID=1076179 RepID=A0A645GBI1_9ZZZZ
MVEAIRKRPQFFRPSILKCFLSPQRAVEFVLLADKTIALFFQGTPLGNTGFIRIAFFDEFIKIHFGLLMLQRGSVS